MRQFKCSKLSFCEPYNKWLKSWGIFFQNWLKNGFKWTVIAIKVNHLPILQCIGVVKYNKMRIANDTYQCLRISPKYGKIAQIWL